MEKEKTTIINIKGFDAGLHRQMKIRAAIEGITIKELIAKAVREYLAKQEKGR